jgi:hypothetical protein
LNRVTNAIHEMVIRYLRGMGNDGGPGGI